MDSSHSTRLLIKGKKKKDVFQESNIDSDEDVPKGTILTSLNKKDSCTSVNLRAGKKKVPLKVVSILFIQLLLERTLTEKCVRKQMIMVTLEVLKYLWAVKVKSSESCINVASDEVEEKRNDNNNVAAVGHNYQNKVDEYFSNLQAKFPMTRYHMTKKLWICLGQNHIPMLPWQVGWVTWDFLMENVIHANDRILHEFMLNLHHRSQKMWQHW